MARIRRKGTSATLLVRDDDGIAMPIMPWGKVHNLSPDESNAARNTTAISADCGVVSIIAIGGGAHFKQGDATVTATISDPYLPAGVWHELPVFEGNEFGFVSVIAASGAGPIIAQIVERQ
ncbi:MAG: hypothetical protein R3349_07275 [Geminicoccaceae bacterium]|nr:hypothetical protein [Geminicoccaceae bacterium]